jgi:ribosome-associated heat shock protein Hsp15
METAVTKTRIDKYLWSIRVFKTRSLASEACEKGRIKVNGEVAKASRMVKSGDQIDAKTEGRPWLLLVKSIIEKRLCITKTSLLLKHC